MQTDRKTNGGTDMTKITAAFYNFANAPKNPSVNAVQGNNRCLFSDPHKTRKYSVCGQNVELLNVKLIVHIVTTGL